MDNKDRHLDTDIRKKHDAEDRHLDTDIRKKDRHLDNKDRHLDNKDRHLDRKEMNKIYHRNKKEQEFVSDTGMDLICCSCVEWKSIKSCTRADKLPVEKFFLYCTENGLTQNSDGKYYISNRCKISIKKILNQEDVEKKLKDC